MKIKIDTQKGAEAVTDFLQKTSDLSKSTIEDVRAGAMALSEKSKQDSYRRRLKKYNPLFPEVFFAVEFNIPNMIVIRDDAERRGIDVCEGAIGWLGKEGGMEILYLYDEAVSLSKLQFVPTADCNAIYYVDRFDRSKFIRVDYIFRLSNNERLAELEHIAYSLGAKSCTIDIVEKEVTSKKTKKKTTSTRKVDLAEVDPSLNAVNGELTAEMQTNYEQTQRSEREGHSVLRWEGSNKPKRPRLKWFEHDEGMKVLIEMRMKGGNAVKSKTLRLSGANSATMSKDTALKIDAAISKIMKRQGGTKLENQAIRETHSEFVFFVEF